MARILRARFRHLFKRRSTMSESSEPADDLPLNRALEQDEAYRIDEYRHSSRMQQTCSDEHLAEIATSITEWREISPFLGLTEAEEHEILGSAPHSVRSQKIAMLRLWKKKKGKNATYNLLCRAFIKSKQLDLKDKMKQILEENEEESDTAANSEASSQPRVEVPACEQHFDPISSYASYLRQMYSSMSHGNTSQHWSHLPRCEFIQLAMIKDEEIRRGGPEEEMIRLAQLGKIETILSHKENINLNFLFKISKPESLELPTPPPPPPSPSLPLPLEQTNEDPLNNLEQFLRPNPRSILLEGAPGGGKSTLALHICHQWAQGTIWLANYDIVVLAYLRDEAIQNANTLADILPADSDISELVPLLKVSYGYRVLFIFDGWDEFPHHLMKNSLVSTIIHQPHKLSLQLSTVLITSRPVSSGNLLHIADRRVEILGFTQHQIHEYIEKALDGNSTRIQKLVQHLEEHPVIEGYCYVPLHVAILVHVFLTLNESLPTTLHELFCSLVLCCIVREQVTHKPDTSLPDLVSLDDLPNDLKFKLHNLSILAYNGVMQDKVVFYSKDLQESHLPSKLSSLGLLQAVEGLTLTSIKSLSCNFLHLSVQELLAAYNISQMVPSEQIVVFKKFFESSRFQAVLHYYCGFTKLADPEIRAFISSFQVEKFSFDDLLPLLHCFYEAQQPSLCQLVDPRFISGKITLDVTDKGISPVDCLVTGYFITSLLSMSIVDFPSTIHLVARGINDHCLKMLLNRLLSSFIGEIPTSLAVSLRLELHLVSITEKGVIHIAYLLKKSAVISELMLSGDKVKGADVLLLIAESLLTNISLTKLNLHSMGISYTGQNGSALTKMLQVNKSLTHLDLSSNSNTSDSIVHCIFEGLQHNTSLVYLNLSLGIAFRDPAIAGSLLRMLQVNNSLTHLDLSDNRVIHLNIILSLFKGLEHNTALRHLILRGVVTTFYSEGFVKYIHEVHDIPYYIAKALISNNCLETLDIADWKFSNDGIDIILESLLINSTLKKLHVYVDPKTLSTFEIAREALNLPPIF